MAGEPRIGGSGACGAGTSLPVAGSTPTLADIGPRLRLVTQSPQTRRTRQSDILSYFSPKPGDDSRARADQHGTESTPPDGADTPGCPGRAAPCADPGGPGDAATSAPPASGGAGRADVTLVPGLGMPRAA